MKYALSGLAAVGIMVATAIPALAATPQQILDKNLNAFNPELGSNIAGRITIDVKETRWVKSPVSTPQNGNLTLNFEQRTLPKEFGLQNSEGALTITGAQISDAQQTMKLDQPIKAQWKTLMPTIYVRLEQVPDSVAGMLKTQGMDLTPYLGKWQRIDIPSKLIGETGQTGASLKSATDNLNNLKQITSEHALSAGRTLKAWTDKQGDKLVRVQIAANKSLLYKDYLNSLKLAYKIKDRTQRNAQIKLLQTEYNQTLKDLAKLKVTADINLAKETVEAVDIGFAQNDLKNECTWNARLKKDVCKNVGRTYVTVSGNLSFLPENHAPVAAPDSYSNLDAVNNFLNGLAK